LSKQKQRVGNASEFGLGYSKPESTLGCQNAFEHAPDILPTKQIFFAFSLLFLLFTTTGATCFPKRSLNEFAPPVIFANTPDVSQISEVLNRTRAIQQLQSNAVSIRSPVFPKLTAKMVWERPRRFRMTGGLSSMTGTDFDLGSNDEIFWMATRQGPQPSLHFARHDQFAMQMERQVLPVSPDWLVEALGIIELDPNTVIGTPYVQAQGLLEIESTVASPIGLYRRTILVDPKSAVVRRVLLRDPSGRLLATALLSDHKSYSTYQVTLPHTVQAQLIPAGGPPIDLTLNIGYYTINDNQGQDPNRWTPPNSAGYQLIDLVGQNVGNVNAVRPAEYQPATLGVPQVSYRGVNDFETVR
jgi:hypothetical protein